MAVAVDLEFDGGTLEQYDEVAKLMDYEPGGAAPPGCLFHWQVGIPGPPQLTFYEVHNYQTATVPIK
jgi:hypothetical protein